MFQMLPEPELERIEADLRAVGVQIAAVEDWILRLKNRQSALWKQQAALAAQAKDTGD
jgi:hypothetical protein